MTTLDDRQDGPTLSGKVVHYTYVDPGDYNVTLKVENSAGVADTDTGSVSVPH